MWCSRLYILTNHCSVSGWQRERSIAAGECTMMMLTLITLMNATWTSTRNWNVSMDSTLQKSSRIWNGEQLYEDHAIVALSNFFPLLFLFCLAQCDSAYKRNTPPQRYAVTLTVRCSAWHEKDDFWFPLTVRLVNFLIEYTFCFLPGLWC